MYLYRMAHSFLSDDQDRTVHRMATPTADSTKQSTIAELTPYVVVLFPMEHHQSIALIDGMLTIGRSQEAMLQIPDEMISRVHCEIRRMGRHVFLRDNNSTNGTFVDGAPFKEGEVFPGNRIQIGSAVLKIDLKDPSEVERDKALFEAATTDALTKLPNRRFFLERAQAECSLARRERRMTHAFLIDVDKFKNVNDTWGHAAGDFILKEVARTLAKVRREEDLIARFGGEEFIFFTSGIDAIQAKTFGERIRSAVETHKIVWEDQLINITISIGLQSSVLTDHDTLDSLIAAADANLYQAKRNGRNQVVASIA